MLSIFSKLDIRPTVLQVLNGKFILESSSARLFCRYGGLVWPKIPNISSKDSDWLCCSNGRSDWKYSKVILYLETWSRIKAKTKTATTKQKYTYRWAVLHLPKHSSSFLLTIYYPVRKIIGVYTWQMFRRLSLINNEL